MSGFHISEQVRLIAAERLMQREIGDVVGKVHEISGGAVEVLWLTRPMHRAWHKAEELEPVRPSPAVAHTGGSGARNVDDGGETLRAV